MATKKGAGGKPQEYDKESGKYGSAAGKLVDAVHKYSDDPERDLRSIGITGKQTGFAKSTPKQFIKTLQAAKETHPLATRWRVHVHEEGEYSQDKVFVTGGGSCVAIEPNGNIISVCKREGDEHISGRRLLKFAIEHGGDRLDAFGDELYKFYTRNGFEPVSWTKFDVNYAPDEWKKAREQGLDVQEEPVIFYKYTGNTANLSYDEFLSKVPPDVDYDAAEERRNREVQ